MAPVALVQGLGGSTAGWAAVVVAGLVQHGVPYALFIRGLRMLPVSEAAILSLLEPVLNPIWVVLFLGEVPSETTIAGGALILGAVGVRVSKRVGE
jgi:drug/metabolite transporter (DMT)-like permease